MKKIFRVCRFEMSNFSRIDKCERKYVAKSYKQNSLNIVIERIPDVKVYQIRHIV